MTHVSEQSTTFNPEALHILGSALDDAWQRLEVRVHLNGSGHAIRTILAKHIIAMAEEGERDRQRRIQQAVLLLLAGTDWAICAGLLARGSLVLSRVASASRFCRKASYS